MSNQVNSMNKGLTVKDLVTTGIFTALLFVFVCTKRDQSSHGTAGADGLYKIAEVTGKDQKVHEI